MVYSKLNLELKKRVSATVAELPPGSGREVPGYLTLAVLTKTSMIPCAYQGFNTRADLNIARYSNGLQYRVTSFGI